jgi:hypothetical protein
MARSLPVSYFGPDGFHAKKSDKGSLGGGVEKGDLFRPAQKQVSFYPLTKTNFYKNALFWCKNASLYTYLQCIKHLSKVHLHEN